LNFKPLPKFSFRYAIEIYFKFCPKNSRAKNNFLNKINEAKNVSHNIKNQPPIAHNSRPKKLLK
jgi:hypothetical protein